ncbi:MAG: type II toxin-antitoxin system Phd/YefM family antitoxin [Casimicrobium sp.]
MQGISATLLARNTSEVLDRVVRERQPILIERGRTVVARLSPEAGVMTAAQALANFNVPKLSTKEGRAWLKDSRLPAVDTLRDPWA